MRIKSLSCIALLCCFVFNATAQTSLIKNADKKYDEYAYVDAIKSYERIVSKGNKEERILQRLGNSYYFIGEFVKALKWYDRLFREHREQEAEYLYRYAQCLKTNGNYKKADEVLQKYEEKAAVEKRAVLSKKDKNYLASIKLNSGRFLIADAGINTVYSEYGTTIFDNKIIFTSARDTGGVFQSSFKWTNKSFSKLYKADLNSDGSVGIPTLFNKKNNQKYNESTPVFTKDGKTMYFTRNNVNDGKKGSNDKDITLLKIYKAEWQDGEWKNVKELPFNSDQYSAAHPALSIDEKILYFASDMPGTLGQSDIYKVSINEDGTFGTPQNLGSEINTEGRETFPFVSGDNELFFASDGRPGLGGLDIYVSKIKEDGSFEEVENVGEPVNSKDDDFAFIINDKTRNGFFTSNRKGVGFDDIYRFNEIKRLVCEQQLVGVVVDEETKEVLSEVSLILFDETRNNAVEVITNQKGEFTFPGVKCGKKYFIKTSKTDYEFKEVSVEIKRGTDKTSLSIELEKKSKPILVKNIEIKTSKISAVKVKPISMGTDLIKLLNIPLNFFDLGKSTIKKTSEPQLQKVVDILKQYPSLSLDIRSHTDSRSSAESNMILSEKRAESTKNWLVQKGIDASRLTAKGFGETQLVNNCADGVKCSEKQHQMNRRSEFIITSL
ncbi:OmpA family protein [Flavobacterium hercynium]|uniref:Flagellar motor protein MotB n=1 Tax=Flavobacterium hercynium TaxID=387094 RepID=A0A226H5S8_9FLAO|nr:OmpA family protein [Flavobacterium hercynium]OXA89011.1 flagellar motor protein MotB [Flavobacterium hercynium]SMP27967.1 WD40-like Beta Propeller Repeat [Flavobacterium hercynium]